MPAEAMLGEGPEGTAESRSGTLPAVEELWRRHRRWVAAILLAHKPSDVDVEDLLQEVAVSMVRKIHTLNDPKSVRPWLRTIAINAARTSARRRNVRLRLVRPVEDAAAVEEASGVAQRFHAERAAQVENESRGRRLLELARQLPEKYREPILLRSIRGMSQKQVAETLGLPETTVETRLARARRMLREALGEDEADSAGPEARSGGIE